jgi:hypothetical protein
MRFGSVGLWMDNLEGIRPSSRFIVAWLLCALPRVAFTLITGPFGDYRHFEGSPPNSYWYPLYSATARFFWSLSGGSLPAFVGIHLAIHALIGPAVYVLAKQLAFPARGPWLAVLGVTVLPYYVSTSGRQPNVGILFVTFAGLLIAFVHWVRRDFSIPSGLLFAGVSLLNLTFRPNILSVIVWLYGLATLPRPNASSTEQPGSTPGRLLRVLTSAAIFAALVGALAWRNEMRTGFFTPFTPNSGYNLYVGNNPYVTSYAGRYDIMSLEEIVLDHGLPEEAQAESNPYKRDRILTRLTLSYMMSHPLETLQHAFLKTLRYWDFRLEHSRDLPRLWALALAVPYIIYGPLAIRGGWLMWKHHSRFALAVLAGSLVAYWLPHVVYFGTIRMRMTTEFLLVMLAARALSLRADSNRDTRGRMSS